MMSPRCTRTVTSISTRSLHTLNRFHKGAGVIFLTVLSCSRPASQPSLPKASNVTSVDELRRIENPLRAEAYQRDISSGEASMKAGDGGLLALDSVAFRHVAERCTRQSRRVVRYQAIIDAHGTPTDMSLLETSGEAACNIAVLDALRASGWKPCTKTKRCDVTGYLSLGSEEHRR